ncbi:DUF397 domain-containing protein [Actinomadura logoneensis]|uniref:DUF397 domain-containing protein n=1 Tax=Actinomadura logoneensis TaxID=2293572 RepID=A0A372JKE1_9ACTN|nr:DUF397 domain-containing protein [Actinomadura logoneensis]RFU40491.1 DUF397 domain-containing protein [Actinomadura logoneensis]
MINWRKSSHSASSGQEDCVQLARLSGGIGVRDSKGAAGSYLALGAADLAVLMARLSVEGAGRHGHDVA